MPQVQRGEDFSIHLQRSIRIIERQHQIAAAFTQCVHRVTDVGGDQTSRDVQAFVTKLSDPARKEAKRQRMRSGNLHDLALPAFQVMQVPHHLAQLFDHSARRHQKQLPGGGQFHRRA